MLQQMTDSSKTESEKRGFDWATDALLLFRTNPESTLQLIEEILRKFPGEIVGNNGVYLLSDLIGLYQYLDFKNFIHSEVNEEQFVLGYRSKIFDVEENNNQEEAPLDFLEVYSENPNFLFGVLVAKLQFMDEGTDESVENKGCHYIEDVFVLMKVNGESTLQFMEILMEKLPQAAVIRGTTITLEEIMLVYGFLGRRKLLEMEFDEHLMVMGYHHELSRLDGGGLSYLDF